MLTSVLHFISLRSNSWLIEATVNPGLWVQCPSTPCSGKLWVPVSDGSRAWGEACWDSVPGSPTGHHHCVIHSTCPAICVLARSARGSVFHFLLASKDLGLPDWPTLYKHTTIVFILETPPSLVLNNACKDLLFFLLGTLISGQWVNGKKKKFLEARLPFLFVYCWFSVWGQFCLFIGSSSGQVYLEPERA